MAHKFSNITIDTTAKDGISIGRNVDVDLNGIRIEKTGGAGIRAHGSSNVSYNEIIMRDVYEGIVIEADKLDAILAAYPALAGVDRKDVVAAAGALKDAQEDQRLGILQSTALYRSLKDTRGIEWMMLAASLAALWPN